MDNLKKNKYGRVELYCHNCKESLNSADVENFPSCPYCNQALKLDEVETLILDPIVRSWIRKNPLANG